MTELQASAKLTMLSTRPYVAMVTEERCRGGMSEISEIRLGQGGVVGVNLNHERGQGGICMLSTVVLAACGITDKQIARHREVGKRTINAQLGEFYERTGVAQRSCIPRYLLENGKLAIKQFSEPFGLTPRMQDALGILSDGRTQKDGAAALYISEKTLRSYLDRGRQKIGSGVKITGQILCAIVSKEILADMLTERPQPCSESPEPTELTANSPLSTGAAPPPEFVLQSNPILPPLRREESLPILATSMQ